MNITSRILQFIPKDLMMELNQIAMDVLIPDNNTKIDKMFAALDKYGVDYSEIASGTNRVAVLIDGYVFKIAMDKAGVRDNWSELSMTQELQPFVIKVYECNGLINVSEYVTVISKSEFQDSKEEMQQILSHLAQGYLLGDVGTINKNFMNWGYRNDGQLVILDFAYIYRVVGDEMMCTGLNDDGTTCEEFLEYDENFHNLICPKCRKKYTFHDIRRRIDRDFEQKELDMIKQTAYKVNTPYTEVNDKVVKQEPVETPVQNNVEGDNDMGKKNNIHVEEVDSVSLYNDALEFVSNMYNVDNNDCNCNPVYEDVDDSYVEDDVNDLATECESETEPVEEGCSENVDEEETDEHYTDPDEECLNEDESDEDEPEEDVDDVEDDEPEEDTDDTDDVEDNDTGDDKVDIPEVIDGPDIDDDNDTNPYEATMISDYAEVSDYVNEPVIVQNSDIPEDDDDDEDVNPYDENHINGIQIIGVGEDIPVENNVQKPTYSMGETLVLSNSVNIDKMRNELMDDDEDEDDVDDYDDEYDRCVEDNQKMRSNKKQRFC